MKDAVLKNLRIVICLQKLFLKYFIVILNVHLTLKCYLIHDWNSLIGLESLGREESRRFW